MATRPARRCTSPRSRDGQPCTNYAMHGSTVCHAHGGKAPQTRRRAAERLAEQKARKLVDTYNPAADPVENPVAGLLQLAGEIRHFKDYLAGRVMEMRNEDWRRSDDKGAEQLRAEIALYERALDRTARVLGELIKLDLEARLVRISEQQGAMLGEVIARSADALLAAVVGAVDEAAAEAVRCAWPGWLGEIVPREIAAVAGGER